MGLRKNTGKSNKIIYKSELNVMDPALLMLGTVWKVYCLKRYEYLSLIDDTRAPDNRASKVKFYIVVEEMSHLLGNSTGTT